MLIVMTSPDAVLRNGLPDEKMVKALREIGDAGNPVGVISNQGAPDWFDQAFSGSKVQFIHETGRQDGGVVRRNAKKFDLRPFDVLTLASKSDDVAMGKNGGALLLGASWAADQRVKSLGLQVDDPADLLNIVKLTANWGGQWYFSADAERYRVRALSDLSTKKYGLSAPQQAFAQALTATVKSGGSQLKALLAVTARSLLMEGFEDESRLLFGAYPSSASDNDDTEVLSDFVHRLRTTVSQVRMASRGEPLFIRHKPSAKRSAGGGGDRTDPTEQLLTLHVNPHYAEKGRLTGRHVIVVDDCTTYGVSFGVAAALLRAGGAAQVTGVALGKFGGQARYYAINIKGNPFKPLDKKDFAFAEATALGGAVNAAAQLSLQDIVG